MGNFARELKCILGFHILTPIGMGCWECIRSNRCYGRQYRR